MLYFDLLKYFAFIIEPISQALNLPPESALAIAVGMLFNLYGAIALGASLGLSVRMDGTWSVFRGGTCDAG